MSAGTTEGRRIRTPVESGIAVVDKPAGLTSHQVVGRIRRAAGTRKVGHAGTLDPMATGVLVVGIERATRLLGHLALTEKEYVATIRLGIATVTDDAEGDVTTAPGARDLDPAAIAGAVSALTGSIQQVPSAVSAIKINGIRSYARVRAGDQVELSARPVTVRRFDILDQRDSVVDGTPVRDLDVDITCSSGTYIRALARDLGAALGTAGHLTRLRRTRVGAFTEAAAQPLDELDRADGALTVVPLADVVRATFPVLDLDADRAAWVRNGRRLPDLELPSGLTGLFGPDADFLALYRPSGPDAVPEAVFV
jgi:tRNA pseudouridine55 synthase